MAKPQMHAPFYPRTRACQMWDMLVVGPMQNCASVHKLQPTACRRPALLAWHARFGAVPVVRRTGGLNDTVFDVDHDAERAAAAAFPTNGFSFEGTDAAGLDYALNRRGPAPSGPPCKNCM